MKRVWFALTMVLYLAPVFSAEHGARSLGPGAKKPVDTEVKVFGAFLNSNRRDQDDDDPGCIVRLWRQNKKMVGLVGVSRTHFGDPQTGTIENVRYNPATGALSFTSEPKFDFDFDKSRAFPHPDLLVKFNGRVRRGLVTGLLTLTIDPCPRLCVDKYRVTMGLSDDLTLAMRDYPSYDEWLDAANHFIWIPALR